MTCQSVLVGQAGSVLRSQKLMQNLVFCEKPQKHQREKKPNNKPTHKVMDILAGGMEEFRNSLVVCAITVSVLRVRHFEAWQEERKVVKCTAVVTQKSG